jgi:hypothetical protein
LPTSVCCYDLDVPRGAAVVLVAACAGCNQLYGLTKTQLIDADTVQVVIDGPRSLTLDPPAVPASAPVDDPIGVTLALHGPAGVDVQLTTTATAGTANPAQTMVSLDANGLGQTMVTYTTPSVAGDVTVTFAAAVAELSAQQAAQITVNPLVSYGYDMSSGIGLDNETANHAVGTKVHTPAGAPVTAEQLGLWVSNVPAGTMVRMGLYTFMSLNPPQARVAVVQPSALVNGRNVFPIPATMLAADTDYWVIAVFDQNVSIPYTGGAGTLAGVQSYNFPMAMTDPWSGSSGTWVSVQSADAFFIRAAP